MTIYMPVWDPNFDVFREALTYPVRGDREPLLVGVALALATGLLLRLGVFAVFALAPAVLIAGYALAVLRESAEGERDVTDPDAPPRFIDFPALAVDGVRALAVVVGYLSVPAAALGLTVGGAIPSDRPATVGTAVFVLGAGTVVLVVSFAFAYLLPAVLIAVGRRRTLRAAFDAAAAKRVATDGRYFVGWVQALAVGGLGATLLGAVAGLGRPGEVAALAGAFYGTVVVARLLGRSAA